MISRAELAELYREDDRLRAEHREWMAQREAQAASLARRNDSPAGLVFKRHDDAMVEPASQGEQDWSQWENWWAARFEPERRALVEGIADGLDVLLKHEEDRTRAEQKAAIAPLEREIAYLRGQLDAVLGLLGKSLPEAKTGEVIHLPSGILRRRNDAA